MTDNFQNSRAQRLIDEFDEGETVADGIARVLEHVMYAFDVVYDGEYDSMIGVPVSTLDDLAVELRNVPEPEPEGPTDEELNDTYWTAWHEHLDRTNSVLHAVGLRAVLVRYGNHRGILGSSPQPPSGEVAELVARLRDYQSIPLLQERERIADLLSRLSPPQPIPVSERSPGPEDCDEEGRCWIYQKQRGPNQMFGSWEFMWSKYASENYGSIYWLPFNALPLGSGEVEA